MKRIITLVITTILVISAFAQAPKNLSKIQKSIVSVNTYDKNGELLHSGTGFYIGKDGEAISDYTLFKDAHKAMVIDMTGKQYDVECILGADDTYSVVRFRTNIKNNTYLNTANVRPENGEHVFIIPFTKEKLKKCEESVIESSSPVMDKYAYYTLSAPTDSINTGCPVFNQKGEVTAILQLSVKDKGYALGIQFKDELTIKAIASSASSMALKNIHISKGLPETVEEALVYTYFKSRSADNDEYLDIMDRFISTFPDNAEGYYRRSIALIDTKQYERAKTDLDKYYSLSEDKAAANYNYAQAIYNKLTLQPKDTFDKWNFDVCDEIIDKSIADYTERNDTNKIYDSGILKAKILISKKDFDKAIGVYDNLISLCPDSRAIPVFYAKSQVCEARGDSSDIIIALMDSAIARFPDPMPSEAANYILRRGRLYANSGKPRKAVIDYNQYCYLVNNQVSDVFYYDRSQIELEARMFQQAYEDISSAISLKPDNIDYQIEKAGMSLRFGYIDESIELCNGVLGRNPADTTALRILGYAQIQKGEKDKARQNLQKAISLGDELAKEIMEKYTK